MTHATRTQSSPPTQRALPRWLFVAAAVGAIGVGIDLVNGPPANALTTSAARVSALAASPLDHAVVAKPADDVAMEPGASVAAYGLSADDAAAAAAATQQADGEALEPGVSVAAYGV